jgi:hypothetical protein
LRGRIGRLRKKEVLEYLHLCDLIALDRTPDAKSAKFPANPVFRIEFSKAADMVLKYGSRYLF